MSRKPAPSLPDLDDEDAKFLAKMEPLINSALPDNRKSTRPNIRASGTPEIRSGLVDAARQQASIEAVRGAKRRFEYLIPERVGRALAEDAAKKGMSATTRLLEVLRDAGYPVIREDLVDLRKMPKR